MPRPFRPNNLRKSDSYKDTHIYPKGLQELLDYCEARGGEFPFTCFFGLQGILAEEFEGQFFTQEDLDHQVEDSQIHFYTGFPYKKDFWQYILDQYEGRLPIEVRAVKEGSVVPTSNVLYTIRDTDPKTAGLASWVEGLFHHNSIATTVCTKSRMAKILQMKYLLETSDSLDLLPFQLHCFGFRSVGSVEEAGRSGCAHLVNYMGSDTQVAMDYAHQFYGAPRVSAYSVGASEHSTITITGKAGEADRVGDWLKAYPSGTLSLVGDSYNIYNFVKEIIGGRYRDLIRSRPGKVVVRPDSGEPLPQILQLLDLLAERFGSFENKRGYRVLAPCVGLLWGDGLDYYMIAQILRALKAARWSTENVVMGMGGGLLRKVNRDTQKFAIKLCHAIIDGEKIPVMKDPSTDSGKSSKPGPLALLKQDRGRYVTVQDTYGNGVPFDQLEPVFRNGEILRFQTLDEIRKLAKIQDFELEGVA